MREEEQIKKNKLREQTAKQKKTYKDSTLQDK